MTGIWLITPKVLKRHICRITVTAPHYKQIRQTSLFSSPSLQIFNILDAGHESKVRLIWDCYGIAMGTHYVCYRLIKWLGFKQGVAMPKNYVKSW